MTSVEEEFSERGVVRGGELLLRPADALALVHRCRELGKRILGVDAFHLTATTRQPDMGESIDLSRPEDWADPVTSCDRAAAFLQSRIGSALFFKTVIEED